MKINVLILLFASLLIISCKKDSPKPKSNATGPITGNSTFFLKKDGIPFHPGYIETGDFLEFAVDIYAAANAQSNADVYSFIIQKEVPVGTYDYETLVEDYGCWFSYSTPANETCYINDGTFEIVTQDTVQKVLDMKFQFEMEDSNGQTYQVTEGRVKAYYHH